MSPDLRAQLVMPAAIALSSTKGTSFVVPGPEFIIFFGVPFPILSMIFGVAGVALGRLLAAEPAKPLTMHRRVLLWFALIGLILGVVLLFGQQPLVAIGWGLGLGFSGLAIAEALGEQVRAAIRTITDAWIAAMAARAGSGTRKEDKDA